MDKKGLLIVISGPSGAGKGTVVDRIMQLENDIELSVSCTTRKIRVGETHGTSYYFISHEEFDERIANDGFLEYAEFVDNKYGTPKDMVLNNLEQGKNIILEIEVNGAAQVKASYEDSILIFIAPPSLDELEKRLIKRGTEDEETSKKRLLKSGYELGLLPTYDYVVINDDVDKAAKKIIGIISAEKCRVERNIHLKDLLIEGEKI